MLQHEFEALTGKRVETEDYNSIIDPMYMSTDMDKQDFCKDFIKHKLLDSTVANELTNKVNKLRKSVQRMSDERKEVVLLLLKAAGGEENELSRAAVKMVGHKEVIKLKLLNGWQLSDSDKAYITENIA